LGTYVVRLLLTSKGLTGVSGKGRKAIKKFLEEGKSIDTSVRRMARIDPTYLPEAATTSRTLAIHFLTSKDGNVQCGYHAYKNKTTLARDGWGREGMKIRGVPGKRKISDQKKKTSLKPPAKGLGNCGCRIDDILLEFVLSKRLLIRGQVKGVMLSEMMMGTQDYMEPRERSFAFEAIRSSTPSFSLNDFFKHGNTEYHKELKVAKKLVLRCVDALNDRYRIHAAPGEACKEYVLVSKESLLELTDKVKGLVDTDSPDAMDLN
jgi:hypothetical protein